MPGKRGPIAPRRSVPTTSIVLPTRNRLSLLQRSVASVLNQSWQDWELIIVDDASEDGTWDWILTLQDRRIRPIRLEHPSERRVARNVGLQAATGEYILFLDDDDYIYPQALIALVPVLMEAPHAIASIGARLDVYDSTYARYPHPRHRRELVIWRELIAGWMPAQGQYVARIPVLRAVGGWSERLETAEDYDLWLRLSRLGPVVFVPTLVLQATRAHPDKIPLSEAQRAKVQRLMDDLRQLFVAQLKGDERDVGERILRGETLWKEALQAYYEGRHVTALLMLTRTCRTAPELFWSPILGPPLRACIVRAMAGLFLGRRNRRKAKELTTRFWKMLMRLRLTRL